MTLADLSPAALHEHGLPPDDFARAHIKVQLEVRAGEDAAAWRLRAFYRWLDRLNALLAAGEVIASGVTCGPCPASADPRCLIHPAHWLRVRLGAVSVIRVGMRIADRVTMPTGEEVIALRLQWANAAAGLAAAPPEAEPLPEQQSAFRRGEFDRWLRAQMEASPSCRTLVKAEIELEAERRDVVARHALDLRSQIIKSDPIRFAAWMRKGSTDEEERRGKIARAEIDKLRAKKRATKRRS